MSDEKSSELGRQFKINHIIHTKAVLETKYRDTKTKGLAQQCTMFCGIASTLLTSKDSTNGRITRSIHNKIKIEYITT